MPATVTNTSDVQPRFRKFIAALAVVMRTTASSVLTSDAVWSWGTGAPTKTDPNGSIYIRLDGTSSTTFYVRTGGNWVAMSNVAAAASVTTAGGQAFVIDALLSATGEAIVKLGDNLANAWEFKETVGAASYLKFVTTNAAEKIISGVSLQLLSTLDWAQVSGTGVAKVLIKDNLAAALEFFEGANSYLKFITTDSAEQVVVGVDLLTKTTTETIGASTAAAGTTTADAGVLPAATGGIYPTTAADDTKGVRVHASDKVSGRVLLIGNGVSNKILKVYAPSGGTINGAAADAAFSSSSGKGVTIACLSSGANTWLAW